MGIPIDSRFEASNHNSFIDQENSEAIQVNYDTNQRKNEDTSFIKVTARIRPLLETERNQEVILKVLS